jgi:N-acetylmuramoyl-L-alanine amidase-like protein
MIDFTHKFKDNALKHRPRRIVVWHWLAGTVRGSIEWLNTRKDGKGSVAYNYMISKSGTIYMLGDPFKTWFHNTGKGSNYDRKTISIAFESMGADDPITLLQIVAAHALTCELERDFHIEAHKHHAELNSKKQDFPADVWAKLLPEITGGE